MSPPDGSDTWDIPRSISSMPESLDVLHRIIDWSRRNRSPLGYFAALYTKVGNRLEEAIAGGKFRSPEQMRKLDVVFFNRYLEALYLWRRGRVPTLPWKVTLDTVGDRRAIVLQHLLLAMNAHIDLDLGVATADAIPPEELDDFERDFDTMNGVLASLMDDIQTDLGFIFPLLKPVNFLLREKDDMILNFSMKAAREVAWQNCLRIARLEGTERDAAVGQLATHTGHIGSLVVSPGIVGGAVVRFVRMRETGDVASRITELLD